MTADRATCRDCGKRFVRPIRVGRPPTRCEVCRIAHGEQKAAVVSKGIRHGDHVLDAVLAEIRARGFEPTLTRESYESIAACGLRRETLPLAFVAADILVRIQPASIRGVFYQVVSAGFLPDTGRDHYQRLDRLLLKLREHGVVRWSWLRDGIRTTLKPPSWSGLADFTETVRDAYRRDFWASLPVYLHVFVEKDAMAGVLQPVTAEYDVALSVVRGFVGKSWAHAIAEEWSEIEKPIFAFYLGDHDPSGRYLEHDLQRFIRRHSARDFGWQRLAVEVEDFDRFNLLSLAPKRTDSRARWFFDHGWYDCAELDAIPAPALRKQLEEAIVAHIPADEWDRLRVIEEAERQSWQQVLDQMNGSAAA